MSQQNLGKSKVQLITTKEIIVFSIIGLLLLFLPLLLTQNAFLPRFNFTNSGQIGDTIGGTTAPFIGFFAAVLVYLSFQQQLKANEIVLEANSKQDIVAREERRFNTLMKLVEALDNAIYQFEYRSVVNTRGVRGSIRQDTFRGVDAIQYVTNKFHQDGAKGARDFLKYHEDSDESIPFSISKYSQLWHLTKMLSYIAKRINAVEIDFELKEELILRLDMSYRTYLQSSLETFLEAYQKVKADFNDSNSGVTFIKKMENNLEDYSNERRKYPF